MVDTASTASRRTGCSAASCPACCARDGLLVAVVLSSLLFGLAHFGNIVSRPDQSVAVTAAQSLGAFTQGIGLVALRLAMDTIWPVMLVHFLGDLFGQFGGLPVVLSNVIESVAMLVFGIWVYRRHRAEMERSAPGNRRARARRCRSRRARATRPTAADATRLERHATREEGAGDARS